MTDKLDCVVVGAGVVGLAVARALALVGREVVVLESESQIGMHASSRNSEVIHAGIYYPEGSRKAQLCVSGRAMLYRYCEAHQVNHERTGKLIVATGDDDESKLRAIAEQAKKNGVTDLQLLDAAQVADLEPAIECNAALLSPSTGIIDSHELMTATCAEIEAKDGVVLVNSEVRNVIVKDNAFHLDVVGAELHDIACNTLVNAAGLGAQRLAATYSLKRTQIPELHLAKAHYFAYQGKSPFQHLIYPLPSDGGLGIHATNDLSGVARFGPDVSWVDSVDYGFDESRKGKFVTVIRKYFPALDEEKLVPAYTGIRPKLSGPGEVAADFVIQGKADHGVSNLVNLFGIESPGLTASLAIGEYVKELL